MNRRTGSPLSLPLAASIAGHAGLVALLVLLVGRVTPLVLPPHPQPPIEIMLAPPPPPMPAVPTPPPEVTAEPPPEVKTEQPPPLPKRAEPPPPPAVHREPPPPNPLPRSKPVVVRRPPPRERAPEPAPARPSVPYQPAPSPPAPLPYQPAAVPRPPAPAAPPGPLVSAAYRAALGAWLERHKRYPEDARGRGETGQAVLRFHVERSGRVLDYAIVKSTGYPELDAAIEQMMRGAVLPPFPADMTAGDIEVSVTLRFALTP